MTTVNMPSHAKRLLATVCLVIIGNAIGQCPDAR